MTIPLDAPSLTLDSRELARDYERISAERQFLAGQRLVQDLAITTGERVLDLGCGTGLLAEFIAERVGPDGYVLGLDPLPLRIEIAQGKARACLEFRVGDAYDLGAWPDASFDAVCLNAVFHWLPEKTGPLREFARILKAGGRLGISTMLKEGSSAMLGAMRRILAQPPFADYQRPRDGMLYQVTADEMRDLLEGSGFTGVRIDVSDSVRVFATAEDAIRFAEVSSFGNFMGHLPEDMRAVAREKIKHALEMIASPEGIREERHRLVAIGVRK